MALSPGTRIGHFEILSFIGAGGMGEVHRARDLTLGRDVALKFVAGAVAPERRARFEREARCLAALSHPGIAVIYGFDADAERPVIVMELVEGETLEKRLLRGPLPPRQALDVGRQIAEALAAAHEKGIVHRDLKPSNVKLAPDGRVKLLDFGLAKVLEAEGSALSAPTLSGPAEDATRAGLVLGTAPYMSPEQARGEELDRRTDIWSFGCVLYEALTGRRAFAGPTRSDSIAAVLEREPDWSPLPAETPPKVRDLLRRCLRKSKADRLRDAWDARLELIDALAEYSSESTPVAAVAAPRRRARARRLLALGVAGAGFAGIALGWFGARTTGRANASDPTDLPTRWTIAFPPGVAVPNVNGPPRLALSADGKTMVFVGSAGGGTQLYVRDLDSIDVRPIPMTEGARQVSFSPDGVWVAFDQGGQLKKVRLDGGAPTPIAEAPNLRGAAWGEDGTIVFAPDSYEGLWRVSANGGVPQRLTTAQAKSPGDHRWPQFLPNGDVLFTIDTDMTLAGGRVGVLSLRTGRWRVVLEGGAGARYVSSGHLVYARDGMLLAAPFDLSRLEVTGPGVPILEDVRMDPYGEASAQFDVSSSGHLAYVPGFPRPLDRSLLWLDRDGRATAVTPDRRSFVQASLSPDGGAVATIREEPRGHSLWSLDLATQTWTQLVDGKGGYSPVWSPDGARLAYYDKENSGIHVVSRNGRGADERLTASERFQAPTSWSPDGRLIAFSQQSRTTGHDIWILPVTGDRRPWPYLATSIEECCAAFSPDGRWIAYASNESGRYEVYVRPFPGPEPKHQVSSGGGEQPKWTRGGREIVFRAPGPPPRLMAVSVELGAAVRSGTPRPLVDDPYRKWCSEEATYDVTRDGDRLLVIEEPAGAAPPTQIVVIPGFLEELKSKLRGAR